ncbi:bacteriophytochrome (light-regulated signal transduction histidine kinase) [Deinococcus koreensis]|uniref:histidine kinase n=1 Tax=Deinococcus koreensis TaxID=2054903 RepID=A0A2K3URT6_9DEIO|nr:bacteriophytochrome (light-regulated signal transduction histidine kinase) [Deinococcus koreensis]
MAALGTLILLLVVLPATTRQAELEQRAALTQLAEVAAQDLDATLDDRARDLLFVSRLEELRSGDPTRLRALLEQLQRDRPEIAWMGWADEAGVVQASTGGLLVGVRVSGRPWFQRARQGPAVVDVHRATLLEPLLPRTADGQPRRFVDLSVPVWGEAGARRGVLGAHLSWTWVQGVERRVRALAAPSRTVEVLILNRAGTVLHGPRELLGTLPAQTSALQDTAPGGRGSLQASWADRPYLAGYAVTGRASAPGLGWRVVVRQDAGQALAPVQALRRRVAVWGLFGALLSALLAYGAARALSRPMSALTHAATALQRRETHGLPHLRQYAEVEQLSHALQGLLAQRREAETRQAQVLASLEQRVEARTAQLTEANAALDAFSASVSHDLRAPIRHVAGFAGILRRAVARGDAQKVEHALDVIDQATAQMGALTEALLEFARTAQHPLRRQPVELAALVASVQHELSAGLEGRPVQWQVADLPVVVGDAALLRQVMTNLLSNALKYSHGRTPATIRVVAESAAGEWRVTVQDNGAGFDPQYEDRLFGLFQRLHRQEEFEGTGIGLANVRRIIERHGGRVWAHGVPGEGATFGFSLPRLDGEPAPAWREGHPVPP